MGEGERGEGGGERGKGSGGRGEGKRGEGGWGCIIEDIKIMEHVMCVAYYNCSQETERLSHVLVHLCH